MFASFADPIGAPMGFVGWETQPTTHCGLWNWTQDPARGLGWVGSWVLWVLSKPTQESPFLLAEGVLIYISEIAQLPPKICSKIMHLTSSTERGAWRQNDGSFLPTTQVQSETSLNQACLWALRMTNSLHDKDRIQNTNGGPPKTFGAWFLVVVCSALDNTRDCHAGRLAMKDPPIVEFSI